MVLLGRGIAVADHRSSKLWTWCGRLIATQVDGRETAPYRCLRQGMDRGGCHECVWV